VDSADAAVGSVAQPLGDEELISCALSPPGRDVDELEAPLPVYGNQLQGPRRGTGLLRAAATHDGGAGNDRRTGGADG
jgi:hypothetical protein